MSYSPYIGVNLDIGHFTAAGYDAVAYIKQHHARITNLHLKDRKKSSDFNADRTAIPLNNFPWGQGDTPIKAVLQLVSQEKYNFPADIEYEYECRAAGTPVEEIAQVPGVREKLPHVARESVETFRTKRGTHFAAPFSFSSGCLVN